MKLKWNSRKGVEMSRERERWAAKIIYVMVSYRKEDEKRQTKQLGWMKIIEWRFKDTLQTLVADPLPQNKRGVQYTYVRQCWPVSWPTWPPDINPVDFYMREPPNTIADISDETIYLKPIVLSYPAQNNSKDWCRENVQAIKVVRLSEHMHMDFLSPCCVVRKAP